MEQHLDEALDKVESLAKELERMKDVEMAEPEFQYGAEAFEAYQKMQRDKIDEDKKSDNLVKKAEKKR